MRCFLRQHINILRIAIICSCLNVLFPSGILAHPSSLPTPTQLLQHHAEPIRRLTSDEAALRFLRTLMASKPGSHSFTHREPSRPTLELPKNIQDTSVMFLASLSLRLFLEDVISSPPQRSPLSPEDRIHHSSESIQWILSKPSFPSLQHIIDLYDVIQQQIVLMPEELPHPDLYQKFSAFQDRRVLNGSHEQFWVRAFQKKGKTGIREQLEEFWNLPDHQLLAKSTETTVKQAYIQHYQAHRLRPYFEVELLKQMLQLNDTVDRMLWDNSLILQDWLDHHHNKEGLRRLCGTWRWIVHNHQNHGDHKMTMTFFPPDRTPPPSSLVPTTITIHGNTVYLRWTFPQGTQEDSLLLSKNDSLLEGTFINSLGPHGSISGKRVSPCPNE